MLTPMETEINRAGWVRCPNERSRWYPGWQGAKQLPMRDVLVTDKVQVVHSWRGDVLAEFETVAEVLAYVEAHGEMIPPGPNVWD